MIRVDKDENVSSPDRPETDEALVDLPLEVWLSREDARQMVENLTGFFRPLRLLRALGGGFPT